MFVSPSITTGHPSAIRIVLFGVVQGFGVRPAIARHARRHGIAGIVRNTREGVEIHAEADSSVTLRRFLDGIRGALPAGAEALEISTRPAALEKLTGFAIGCDACESAVSVSIPVDTAFCDRCRDESRSQENRRFRYPFISCAACGPRYSILHSVPHERKATSMSSYALCEECQREYDDSEDHRCHAQTISCPACGPKLWTTHSADSAPPPNDAIAASAAAVLRDGGIVALRGIGGYQLICDAASDDAVSRLRCLKQRPTKPLAVMIASSDGLSGTISAIEREALGSAANPIVVLDAVCRFPISALVNPGRHSLGVFLPTTALHDLLLQLANRPLVVTSGNREGEPILYTASDAEKEFASRCDLVVHHDREIVRPIDDSVIRVIGGRPVTLRCARGLAPMRLDLANDQPMLAVGGQQKTAIALSNGQQTVLCPHIGDMNTVAARERFVQHVDALRQLYDVDPQMVVHDLHPDYFTTRWAQEHGSRTIAVQHHHAHIAAGMLEHGLLDREVLGVAFDGTGYGTDGTVWGGEFLLATAGRIRRVAHLLPIPLIGGDSVTREPWKVALAMLALCKARGAEWLTQHLGSVEGMSSFCRMLKGASDSRQFTVCSSVGRLFDGLASLILRIRAASFEGEPATALESHCGITEQGAYGFDLFSRDDAMLLDWRPVVRSIVSDLEQGVCARQIAMRFHRGLACAVADVAARYSQHPVVVGGGCFQNRVLTELLAERLHDHPSGLFLPGRIPPNDGGLAAGQLAVAAAIIRSNEPAEE